MTSWTIVPASEAELPACLALLQPVTHPDVLVHLARDEEGSLAGAAGVLWQSWGRPPGFPLWVHVLPDRRRRGAGRALVRSLIDRIGGEAGQAWAAQPLEDDSPASAFAQAYGFESAGGQLHFEADGETFLAHMERIVGRLAARGRIPASARTVDLEPALMEPAAELVARELSTAPRGIGAMMLRALVDDPATAAIDRTRSKILLVDGRVAGALLSRRRPNGRDSQIVCNVVGPEWRKGWANVVLLESTTRAGVAGGGVSFRFDCADTNRDTIGLAERCGAPLVRKEKLFRYAVASAG